MAQATESQHSKDDPAERVHRWVVMIIAAIMAVDLVLVVLEGQFLNAVLILCIAGLLIGFTLAGERLSVRIPYEFQ